MARKAREKSPTGIYNIILNGNKDIFRDENDYQNFIQKLNEINVYSYSIFPDRVFLCVKESLEGIASDMRSLIISYARYFNKKYELEGKIFSGRFKSCPVLNDSELKNSINIIENASVIMKKPAHSSGSPNKPYTMTGFFAYSMGLGIIRKTSKATAPKTLPEPVIPKKKPQNLPAWLL